MIDLSKLKVGTKVRYEPSHFDANDFENGIIKRIEGDKIFVVYNCDRNWDQYMNYTAALTMTKDLKLGWRYKSKKFKA